MTVLGRTVFARQKKSQREYEVVLNGQHLQVLAFLWDQAPASDFEIVRGLTSGSHQLGARRCELRDAGLVEQHGNSRSGMTWRLTQAGRDLMEEVLTRA